MKSQIDNLKDVLDQLEPNSDELRRSEINNLRQVLVGMENCIVSENAPRLDQIDIADLSRDLEGVRERVKELVDNPCHAGNHEAFRV